MNRGGRPQKVQLTDVHKEALKTFLHNNPGITNFDDLKKKLKSEVFSGKDGCSDDLSNKSARLLVSHICSSCWGSTHCDYYCDCRL